jgi:phosphoribosylanthranilate isomerase
MRTRIKVCGIASVDEARLAVEAGVDALGFNCVGQASPRTIADSTVAEITKVTPPAVATFLLTLEQTADAIAAHIRRTGPTTGQILSPIDPAESALLARLEPHLRRVQVIHVESRAVLEMIPVYSPYVHAFLLDSGRPNAATPELGGTGRQARGGGREREERLRAGNGALFARRLDRQADRRLDRGPNKSWEEAN